MTCPSHDSGRASRWPFAATRSMSLVAAVLMLAMPAARAADWPSEGPLRGSYEPPAAAGNTGLRWDGVNFGAHLGVGGMNTDFGSSNSQQVAYDLRNTTVLNEQHPETWTTLPVSNTNGRSFGGFIGYSTQWDEVILGVDVAYNYVSGFDQTASDSISRQFSTSDGYQNQLTINGQSSVKLKDYATFRGRAGYAFGQFLPYGFAGVAVGRFDYAVTTRIRASGQDVGGGGGANYNTDNTYTDAKNNAFSAGFTGGLGLDVAVTPNIFLRAEWEYIAFATINGIRNTFNTGRVGVGVRF